MPIQSRFSCLAAAGAKPHAGLRNAVRGPATLEVRAITVARWAFCEYQDRWTRYWGQSGKGLQRLENHSAATRVARTYKLRGP